MSRNDALRELLDAERSSILRFFRRVTASALWSAEARDCFS
jgi:hypothetical protein